MNLKAIYRYFIGKVNAIPLNVEYVKTFIMEWYSIIWKYPVYKDLKWNKSQKEKFNMFWKENYGKVIPSLWHKLYQKSSGNFCVEYMPEIIYTTKIEPLFNDYNFCRVLEDKSLLEILAFGAKDCVVPETILICSKGVFKDENRKIISEESAKNKVIEEKNIIIKPSIGSSSGQGISIIREFDEDKLGKVFEGLGEDFIIQKLIVAHEKFSRFNASSINTIRIVTYILDNKIYHSPIVFRIGRSGSTIDNVHAGGLAVGVNDDGTLLKYAYELGYGDSIKKYEKHPDSGVVFVDYKLPGITQIIEIAYSLLGRFPHINIISWDFTVDNKGNIVLIEANIRGQGVWLPQMIHGRAAFGEQTKNILKKIRL